MGSWIPPTIHNRILVSEAARVSPDLVSRLVKPKVMELDETHLNSIVIYSDPVLGESRIQHTLVPGLGSAVFECESGTLVDEQGRPTLGIAQNLIHIVTGKAKTPHSNHPRFLSVGDCW